MICAAECGDAVILEWYASLPKHDTVLVSARMSHLPVGADAVKEGGRRTTISKGLDIRYEMICVIYSRLWRRDGGTMWIGPLSLPCTPPRTSNELGDVCSLPSCCKGSEKPCALYSFCVGACTLVNEANGVVNGAVRVTFRVEMPVRSPAIADDRSAGFDPSIYNDHQSVGGSVRNGTIEHRSEII